MASEADDLVPISALQHVVFCPRQAALIHVERIWQDNTLTVKGSILHERVDLPGADHRRAVRVERAVALRSERLRAAGVADAVEYHRDDAVPGGFRPVPVEYKRGKAQQRLADQVQLCAQAMCLEEQHHIVISCGFLYYKKNHRQIEVPFTEELRSITMDAARKVHDMIRLGSVPPPEPGPKCRRCSLSEQCLPDVSTKRAADYVQRLFSGAFGLNP